MGFLDELKTANNMFNPLNGLGQKIHDLRYRQPQVDPRFDPYYIKPLPSLTPNYQQVSEPLVLPGQGLNPTPIPTPKLRVRQGVGSIIDAGQIQGSTALPQDQNDLQGGYGNQTTLYSPYIQQGSITSQNGNFSDGGFSPVLTSLAKLLRRR